MLRRVLPLKRFGNWRAKLKHEEPASAGKLLYRRGGALTHMTSHMTKETVPAPANRVETPGCARRLHHRARVI